jgi:hypothetical protein
MNSEPLAIQGMHEVMPARAVAVRSSRLLTGRVWHQVVQEWRYQRGLVLLEWLLLAGACYESLQEKPEAAMISSELPTLLALVIIARAVQADAPGNADVASHTRPLGRGVVWAAKVLFFTLTLLLPWVLHGTPQFMGYGFGPGHWLGLVATTLLPAALLGALAAGVISQANTLRQNIALSAVALSLAFAQGQVLRNTMEWGDKQRCGAVVAGVLLLVTLLAAWWHQSVRLQTRAAWLWMIGGLVAACVLPHVWTWNWRALPVQRYEGAPLALHVGAVPDGGGQELWPTLHLTGLPADHVAAVIALAPVPLAGEKWPPEDVVSSDYTTVDMVSREANSTWRWMTENHTAALVPHYPPNSLWHGQTTDRARGPELKELVKYTSKTDPGAMQRPWRLRVVVQRLRRVLTSPLKVAMHQPQTMAPVPGERLDFWLKELDDPTNGGSVKFGAMLRRRFPLMMPEGEHALIRPLGFRPLQNFIAVLHSPALGEVRVSHEGTDQFNYRDSMLLASHDRPAPFKFPHPRAQMDIAGLTLREWVADSTLDFWWAEDCGVVDLEISAAEMQRAVDGG